MKRHDFHLFWLAGLMLLLFTSVVAAAQPLRLPADQPFVRPGMLQTREDMAYVKQQVQAGVEPWKTAFENLKKATDPDFQPEAYTHVSIGAYGTASTGGKEFYASARAALQLAMLAYLTDNEAYAQSATRIIRAWSDRLWDLDDNDAKLTIGYHGIHFLHAAEILKFMGTAWSAEDDAQFTRMIRQVFYPTIEDFFPEANGNWDGTLIHTMLCIGVWTGDHRIFNRALQHYLWGAGNGGLTRYFYPTGQPQETTRDWGHVQMGIGAFAQAAQVALTQGVLLFDLADNRLALGFEYCARYLLGGDIPVFGVRSDRANGTVQDIFEPVYQYYTGNLGIDLPGVKEIVETRTRPHASLGLLLATKAPADRRPAKVPVVQPDARAKLPSETGALAGATAASFPSDAVFLEPGADIQAAIDRYKGTGRWIVLRPGVHSLSQALRLESGITLAGEGARSILFLDPSADGYAIRNTDKNLHDVALRDLLIEAGTETETHFDPNSRRMLRAYLTSQRRGGVLLMGDRDDQMQRLSFRHVTIQNGTQHGLAIRGAKDVSLTACDVSDNGGSVVPGPGFHQNIQVTHSSNVDINACRADTSPAGNGIEAVCCRNLQITACESARNGRSGIRVADSRAVTVTDCLVEGNLRDGIGLETLIDGCPSAVLRGNLLQLNGGYGLRIPEDAVRTGNTLRDNRRPGR